MKVTTFRMTVEMAEEVAFMARAEGIPEQKFIREAIAEHLRKRRADPAFQARLQARIKADRAILDRLAGS